MATPRFEVYEKTGWRWKLIAGNGETVATSEPYENKSNAKRGAETVKAIAPEAEVVAD